jgi:hypothetical protein
MRRLDQDYLEGPPRHEPASLPPNRADDTMFSCARKRAIHGTSAIGDRKAVLPRDATRVKRAVFINETYNDVD